MGPTSQTKQWDGRFGREYTDRNPSSAAEMDALYEKQYGVTRTALNARFLAEIPKDAHILEVGCNIGNQLLILRHMGYENLNGIDIQKYALQKARSRMPNGRFEHASVLEIPFPDSSFDLVFTSVVLIHVAPNDLAKALNEIHRCTRRYIWGIEYYAPEVTMIRYRGHEDLLWKADYANLYLEAFQDLELLRMERIFYLGTPNEDRMFLLKKKA
jgi:pseudaminic acid biosynthesis-associated methylase